MIALATLVLALAAPDAGVLWAPVTLTPLGKSSLPAAPSAKPPDVARLPFTSESIQQVVRARQPEFESCYEQTMAAKDRKLEGKVHTRFVITPSGTVEKASVLKKGTSLNDAKLHACIVQVLGTMHFPKPPDSKDHPVEYPLNLKAIE